MNFKDYKDKPGELLGKLVLYESGQSYSKERKQSIMKIVRVLKSGFKLEQMPNVVFSYGGSQKGLGGLSNMSTISTCTLLTDEEADTLRKKWKRNKEETQLREELKTILNILGLEQLLKIKEIL